MNISYGVGATAAAAAAYIAAISVIWKPAAAIPCPPGFIDLPSKFFSYICNKFVPVSIRKFCSNNTDQYYSQYI